MRAKPKPPMTGMTGSQRRDDGPIYIKHFAYGRDKVSDVMFPTAMDIGRTPRGFTLIGSPEEAEMKRAAEAEAAAWTKPPKVDPPRVARHDWPRISKPEPEPEPTPEPAPARQEPPKSTRPATPSRTRPAAFVIGRVG